VWQPGRICTRVTRPGGTGPCPMSVSSTPESTLLELRIVKYMSACSCPPEDFKRCWVPRSRSTSLLRAVWRQVRPGRATDKKQLGSRDPPLCVLWLRPPPAQRSIWRRFIEIVEQKTTGGNTGIRLEQAPAHALRWALIATMTEHFYRCSYPDYPGP